jgi:hypothetical protein
VQDFWERLLNDKRYWPELRRRFKAGKAQHIEKYLWEQKFGRAPQHITVTRRTDHAERAQLLRRRLGALTDAERHMWNEMATRWRAFEEEADRRLAGQTPAHRKSFR